MDPWSVATPPLVAARWPLGAHAATHRSRGPPAGSGRLSSGPERSAPAAWRPWEAWPAQTLRYHRLGPCQVYRSGLPLLTTTRVLPAYQVYHSGLKLDDPLTKERTHDYLLFTSPRKVSRQW